MLEVFLSAKNGRIMSEIRDVDIPEPGPDEVLVQVVATDSNPKDWKVLMGRDQPLDSGDDIAGIVHKVGSNVIEYKPGDRVAAFHKMSAPHGSYAEYAIAPASTTFILPPSISFEEGATLPLAAMTAALGLYQSLGLPTPWNPVPDGKLFPVLIYGGATSVGAFALKLAKLSNLNPIITVAGDSQEFVESLNAAHHIIDYRKRNVVGDILNALGGTKLYHAFDVTCDHGSWDHIIQVLSGNPGAHIDMLDIPSGGISLPENLVLSRTYVASAYGSAHKMRTAKQAAEDGDFAYIFYRYLTLLLQNNRFSGHPYEIRPGGLTAVKDGIQDLYDRKIHAKKVVYRYLTNP
ncbi:putative zinc binding dehydrogenase [Xylogone sp. PMI_703]|nr:putative zinc binding dehydrogenase [Xylogone sp. PMI_703]